MADERHRVFFAVWPDNGIRDLIVAASRPWQSRFPFRWTSPDKLHLTLAFIGDVGPDRLATLLSLGDTLPAPSFDVSLDSLELWRRPEVLCLAASHTPAALQGFVDRLNAILEAAGFPVEKRPYKPHLTLARRARQRPEPAAPLPPFAWRPRHWCLAESRPVDPGSPYRILRSWPLEAML